MNESVTTKDGRHTLRMERRLSHSLERVWRAISEPKQLSAWWPMKIDGLPLEVGAPLRFYDENGTPSVGAVTEVQPGRVLAFHDDGGGHAVRLELLPDEQSCLLAFTHSFPADQAPAQHATGWHLCFERLEALLGGQPVPPLGYDSELRRHYEEVLALHAAGRPASNA